MIRSKHTHTLLSNVQYRVIKIRSICSDAIGAHPFKNKKKLQLWWLKYANFSATNQMDATHTHICETGMRKFKLFTNKF